MRMNDEFFPTGGSDSLHPAPPENIIMVEDKQNLMEIAPDTNIFYYLVKDCRFTFNSEKCKQFKEISKKVMDLAKVEGCVIVPTVAKETKKSWLEEYGHFCKVEPVTDNRVKKFVEKLAVRAFSDEEFLEVCTSKGGDRFERIKKAMDGDWKAIGEAIALGAMFVSFDKNVWHPYCEKVYNEVAEDVFGEPARILSAKKLVEDLQRRAEQAGR